MTLDAIVQGLLDQMAANPMPKLWEVPPAQGRELYRAMSQTLEPQGGAIGKIENLTMQGPAGQIRLRVYRLFHLMFLTSYPAIYPVHC